MKLFKAFAELTLGRVLILGIFMTAGYYFSYFDAGEAIEAQIETAKGMVATESTRREGIEQTMKKEEEMRGNLLQLQRNLDVVKSKIPVELKDTEMQLLINAAATNAGVSINELSAIIDSSKPADAPAVEVSIRDVKPENLIEEVKFRIVLIGTFESFLKFLDSIAREDKVIKIRDFAIEKNSGDVDEDKVKFAGDIVGFKQAKIKIIPGVR